MSSNKDSGRERNLVTSERENGGAMYWKYLVPSILNSSCSSVSIMPLSGSANTGNALRTSNTGVRRTAGGDYGRWCDRQLASFLPLMDHIPLDITAVIVVSAILISSPVWMKDNDAIKIWERVLVRAWFGVTNVCTFKHYLAT